MLWEPTLWATLFAEEQQVLCFVAKDVAHRVGSHRVGSHRVGSHRSVAEQQKARVSGLFCYA